MARRYNHYEAAFEDYVRSRGWPYLPVDEQKKAIFAGKRIKSFDFLVYRPDARPWLVDVKGRKFPYEGKGGRRYWENWVTRDDLEGLAHWRGVFGDNFEPGMMFVYWLQRRGDREPSTDIHVFRNQTYAFLWIAAEDYAAHARRRSPKWDTVSLPARTFRNLVRTAQPPLTPPPAARPGATSADRPTSASARSAAPGGRPIVDRYD